MENFYEEVYQYLIERGIEDDEATEVVNHLYEANVHEYGLITENKSKAVLNMLRAVGMMTGILKTPTAKKAVQTTTKKIVRGTPLQGNLLTKTGKAQNFTRGRTPFTSTSPVPAASSPLPKPPTKPAVSPGQMTIPGMSPRAQDLRNITRNPNLGLPGNKSGFSIGDLGSERLAKQLTGQQAPKPWWDGSSRPSVRGTRPSVRTPGSPAPKPEWNKTPRDSGGATVIPRTNANTRVVQPQAPAPAWTGKSTGIKPPTSTKSGNLKTGAVAGITAAGAGVALSGDKGSKTTSPVTDNQKQQKLAQQRAETRAASKPKPELTGERSASANAARQEKAKVGAQRLSSAARDFDKTFAAARKAGKSEFTWRGKRYNTKLK